MASTASKIEIKAQPEELSELVFDKNIRPSTQFSRDTDKSQAMFERLRILWENRRFLGRAILAGLVFGTVLAFVLPTRYRATTQLMPPDSQSASGMAMLASLAGKSSLPLGSMAGDLLGLQTSGDLFIGVLRSRTLEDRLIARFDLKRVYWKSLDEDARKLLEDNSSINQDRKSGIISITVTDHDPKRATAIAQAYVEELDRLVADVSTSAARRERIFLEQRLQTVKSDLDQASRDFGQFAARNGAIDIKEQGRAMLDAAATLMGQLIAAESELKGLEAIYVPTHVRVRAVQARIQELRSQLEKLGGEKGFAIEGLDPAGTSTYPSIRELPLLGETYADLYRRTKIQEAVYETLTQQYELAKVQEAKETPSVKVLDLARVPERKSFPPRIEIIILCTLLALMGASCWILLQARWAEIDSAHPGKMLAAEIFQSLRGGMRAARREKWALLKPRRWNGSRDRHPSNGDGAADPSNTSAASKS
jgi:capsule polysaccharide export protein KpsE/RkpR